MKTILLKALVTLFIVLGTQPLTAKEIKITQIEFNGKDIQDKKFKLQIQSYINHLGSHEIHLQAAGAPHVINGANPTLGFGRDLNANGLIDTWFLVQDGGIKTIKKEGHDLYGRDVLPEILLQQYRSTFGLYAKTATLAMFKYLLISTNEAIEVEKEFYRDWMDLQESNLLFEELNNNPNFSLTYEQIQEHYRVQSEGYQELANRMDRFAKLDFWAYTGTDVALWFSGAVLFKWAGQILAKSGSFITESAVFQSTKAQLSNFVQNQKIALLKNTQIFKDKIKLIPAKKSTAKVIITQATKLHWKTANLYLIRGTRSKNILLKAFSKTSISAAKLIQGAFSEWQYIALNASVQLGSETFAHWEEVKGDDLLDTAQNILSNKDIQQNIAFMSSETIMMTAASKNLKTTKAKFAVGGMIAMTNSTQMNLLIKGEDNYERIAFDTGWEMIIGNSQVQLDLMALQYFEKLSVKKNNPKLKLVGYAVALVDMFAGYYVYSKASTHIEQRNITLVPILVEN